MTGIQKKEVEHNIAVWINEYISESIKASEVWQVYSLILDLNGPLTWYEKMWATHAQGMPGTFSLQLWVRDPNMLVSLTSGFLWSRWWEKKVAGIPGVCTTHTFAYPVRDPCQTSSLHSHQIKCLVMIRDGLCQIWHHWTPMQTIHTWI